MGFKVLRKVFCLEERGFLRSLSCLDSLPRVPQVGLGREASQEHVGVLHCGPHKLCEADLLALVGDRIYSPNPKFRHRPYWLGLLVFLLCHSEARIE